MFGKRSIIIVSGLPRSGTSLMMQMLAAGGVATLTDDDRPADASNPHGYFEYAPVKRLHRGETDWVRQARGKAVKVVSPLLIHLPGGEHYRIIFMQRDLAEIIASQQAMRTRLGAETADAASLRQQYERHLLSIQHWLRVQAHVTALHVDFAGVIADPGAHVGRVADFIGGRLSKMAMISVVEPALYRQRGD